MQYLSGPIYNAYSNRGMIAQKTLDFGTDNQAYIPLVGTWQGDPAYAKSLHVKNFGNNADILVTISNRETIIPPYNDAYIAIDGESQCVIECNDPTINSLVIEILTWNETERLIPRGVAPESDPFFNDVIGIWSFDANDGVTICQNNKTTNFKTVFNFANNSAISETVYKFGSSSAWNGGTTRAAGVGASIAANASTTISNGSSFTIEFWLYCNFIDTTSDIVFGYNGVETLAISTTNLATVLTDGKYALYVNNATTGKSVSSEKTLNAGQWHHVSFNYTAGYAAIFIDGVLHNNEPTMTFNQLSTIQLFNQANNRGNMYVDELRITQFCRYTKNFTPRQYPFLKR